MEDLLRDFCIKEHTAFLEERGVDTVCFMGYGYNIEDVNVGAEFYFSYWFYCRDADYKRLITQKNYSTQQSLEHTLNNCLAFYEITDQDLTDRYKLISKYKYFKNKIFGGEYRWDYVTIKNLRTKEVIKVREEWLNHFHKFLFISW